MNLCAVQVPVTELRRHGNQCALLQFAIESRLQTLRIELLQHRVKRDAQAGQHRHLVVSDIVKGIFERLDGTQIGGVTLDEQVMKSVVYVGRELERVVVRGSE